MSDEQLTAALNLMRRMPPAQVENSLAGLIELVPELTDDLLNNVDQPLKVAEDPEKGEKYIECDYNRDGDSHRSPWSNKYFHPATNGFLPNKQLREMEVVANHIFNTYRQLYFEGGVSSVYFFETDEDSQEAFGACFLIHKDVDAGKALDKGFWDSTHVFDVRPDPNNKDKFIYTMTTTVMVSMGLLNDKIGDVDLSGSMTKHETQSLKLDKDDTHISNMGTMLEKMELRIRNTIEGVYIQKTREIVNGIRSASGIKDLQGDLARTFAQAIEARVQK